MAYKEISRADAAAIISEQKVSDIIAPAEETSVVLNTFETVQMSKKTLSQPLLASLPEAFFVGESATDPKGIKPTTKISWTSKSMTAEEIAVIVPIHENLFADADVDIWAQIRPKIAEAFALKLDNAVLYGVDAPTSWTDANIVGKAVSAGNTVAQTAKLDEDFNALIEKLELDEFDVTDIFAVKSLRSKFRGLKDSTGAPLYLSTLRDDRRTDSIFGYNLRYLHKRVTATGAQAPLAIAVDRSQYRVGIREDFTVKFLDQASLTGDGGTQINLAERDMIALRFKFRVAFGSFATPLLHEANDYPGAVLRTAAA